MSWRILGQIERMCLLRLVEMTTSMRGRRYDVIGEQSLNSRCGAMYLTLHEWRMVLTHSMAQAKLAMLGLYAVWMYSSPVVWR